MSRRFKKRERKSGLRDARLIIIATEGTKTEPVYFEQIRHHYRDSRIKVITVTPKDDTKSSPNQRLKYLDDYRSDNDIKNDDEFWLVIDIDQWTSQNLRIVTQHCYDKNYNVADSNPCFEVWLLLHHVDIDTYPPDKIDLLTQNPKISKNRTALEQELLNVVGEHNKSNLKPEHYMQRVEVAIEHAQRLDKNPDHRWMNSIGTRVYRLAQSILDKKSKT